MPIGRHPDVPITRKFQEHASDPKGVTASTPIHNHYDSHDQLRQHLADFVAPYNFGRMLKTLRGLTPYEAICKAWQNEPERFTSDPHHQIPRSNT